MVDCGVSLAEVEDGPGVTELSTQRALAILSRLPLNGFYDSGEKKKKGTNFRSM